ncbi:MAG: glutamate--tRNA ligase, partial [Actinobacteria bacterium]|nr:glutamate--tRNA ligase [Actinomycetota bacterium]
EATDIARDSEESYVALLEAMRWLGLNWDEGPEVGGPYEPYRQSARMRDGVYTDVANRLREGGFAYDCYCSTEELEARREQAMAERRAPGYDRHCRALTADQIAGYLAEGRAPVLRFRMPDNDSTWDDLVRGPITFAADQVPDFVLVRANGEPLYTLVNPVDDALMRITHVLRGEDLLSSTPRQLALYGALAAIGVSDGTTPRFGHLPYVMGEGNKKLSKRDPESSLQWYRDEGFLPEALLNYLALLGWSMGEDREFFGKDEMAAAFTLDRVSPNPARFDL